ncbi:MAG TPA: FliI/YscN family ATPase [Candidatus Latescibacteria bacterium]|nr:FliI/YscN family ATPase [Candidatus Latescibacterota bacterium]
MFPTDVYIQAVREAEPIRCIGKVERIVGLVIESSGPPAPVGELCRLRDPEEGTVGEAEVVGFRDGKALLMPLGEPYGLRPGCEVISTGGSLRVPVGDDLLGRVLDGLGNPVDGRGPLKATARREVYGTPPNPLYRRRITEPLPTGVRAIDGLLTLGKGQRMGIFAGSGVGKSVLLGMIARNTSADVNVVALVGERGREVREFLERDLGEEGLGRSVVVVATSDRPPLERIKAALVAISVAEHFRDQGKDVMFLMDSLTRVAMAQREVGLSVGEPPTSRGYTPSVFTFMAKFLERAGSSSKGSITGLYTVLVEGDDLDEPISDAARSFLDGHIVLSRKLASMGHYPAIDPLSSVSRVMVDVVSHEHLRAARRALGILATYREAEDLIQLGAYKRGSNRKVDEAIERIEDVRGYLRQDMYERAAFEDSVKRLLKLFPD